MVLLFVISYKWRLNYNLIVMEVSDVHVKVCPTSIVPNVEGRTYDTLFPAIQKNARNVVWYYLISLCSGICIWKYA